MLIIIILILAIAFGVWFICGILAFGNHLATFQFRFPLTSEENWKSDFRSALMCFFFGPIALAVGVNMGDWRYGLLFHKPYMMHWRVEQIMKQGLLVNQINQIISKEFERGPYKND